MNDSSFPTPGSSSQAISASSSATKARPPPQSISQLLTPSTPILSAPLSATIPSSASTSYHIKFTAPSELDPGALHVSSPPSPAIALQITRLPASPQSQHRRSPSSFHASRRRKCIQDMKETAVIVQLENTLKLRSLGVSSSRPNPSAAPKVTLSDQCRPDAKVIFDQSHFLSRPKRNRRFEPTVRKEQTREGLDEQSFALSTSTPAARQVDKTQSDDSTNTMTSPTSIGSLLNGGTRAETSSMTPDIDSQSITSNASSIPSSIKKSAWSTPRSWAEMAAARNGLGSNIIVSSTQVFSENLSDFNINARDAAGISNGRTSNRKQANGKSKSDEPVGLEEAVRRAESQFTAPLTYPRGMINRGNLCFANAILQVLVYCAPFYNLFHLVADYMTHDFHNHTPLMEAVIAFLSEFKRISPSLQTALRETPGQAIQLLRDVQAASEPFVPDYLYDAMKRNKRFDAMRSGHQEDAEEFLGFFLDTLHEELLTAIKISKERLAAGKGKDAKALSTQQSNEQSTPNGLTPDITLSIEREVRRPISPLEGDGWLEVGQKGKTSFTRTTSTAHSPITRIFGGKLRSLLRVPGSKDSVTLEPYQPLQLDIQPAHVTSIEEALENLTVPEIISGVQSSLNRAMVEATKQVFIETLPPILILHLKRFVYDDVGGVQKSSKVLSYGPILEISERVISPARRSEAKRRYRLFGVIYHHGNQASGGHYTVDVLKQDQTEWLHIDDTQWSGTKTPSVRAGDAELATRQSSRDQGVAYLLFYVREDAVSSNGIVTNPAANGQSQQHPQHQHQHQYQNEHANLPYNQHQYQHQNQNRKGESVSHQRMASAASQRSLNGKR